MENHLTRRKELIELERSKGHTAHRTYSPKELRVNEIIHSLRLEEGDTDDDSWRGMPYNARSKAKMQKSRLFGALRRINKGCALHLHLDACGTTQGLVDLAFEQDTLCIESDLPFVGPSFPESALFTFSYHPPSSPLFSNPTPTLYTPSYIPHTPVPLKIVRANYPESLGGPKGFDEMVKRRLVVDPSSTGWSPKRVWDQFQSIFNLSGGLLGFEPVWEAYIEQVLRIYIADKVPYLEARINFLPEFMTSISGSPTFAHADWIRSFQRIVTKLRLEFPDRFYGAKIIYSTIRIVPPGHLDPATKSKSGLESTIAGGLRWYLEDCLALRREFGELICGFDLVGWEDGLRPLMDYMEDLLWFKEQEGRVPFLFHAGETNGDGNRADLNLYDAILLGTKRIGHGVSLAQHPVLMDLCKERQIAIECCPISNELLRYTANVATHPLKVLMSQNVPICLSADDPQIFDNPGLSPDFYAVFNASDRMDIVELSNLARKSIGYSMMNNAEKEEAWRRFNLDWEVWLDEVIAELGEGVGKEDARN